MTTYRNVGLLALSLALLASCSTVERINPFKGGPSKEEVSAAEKAGRIPLVNADAQLQADPALVASAVILPDARQTSDWSQAGRSSEKVAGHVDAGAALAIDWTWTQGKGSSLNRALTVAPVIAHGKIFVFDSEQTIYAIDQTSGKTVWKHELSSGNKKDKRAFGGGMAFSGDRLVVSSGYGFVVALNASTGAEIWKQMADSPMTGSPTIIQDSIYVTSNNNDFYAMSLETGAIEWSDQAIAESARVLSSPSPAGIEEFVVTPYSSGELIAYLTANGHRLWTDSLTRAGRFTPISAINDIASRPVLANGLVFASSQSGVLAAIDGRTGTRVWSLPFGSTQAPAIVGEYVFAVSVDAQLACVEAVTGRIVWIKQLTQFQKPGKKKGRISYSGPLIASNRIITLSSDGRLSAFSPQTGELLEEKQLVKTGRFGANAGFFLEPVAADGRIYALADSGKLFAIR